VKREWGQGGFLYPPPTPKSPLHTHTPSALSDNCGGCCWEARGVKVGGRGAGVESPGQGGVQDSDPALGGR
jgi:hypothetical protein